MTFDELLNNFQTYLLVFARIIGIFIYNPLMSRKNAPAMVRVGASVGIAFLIGSTLVPETVIEFDNVPMLAFAFIKEGIVGIILGFMTQLFLSTILVSGEIMDMQSGLGMAKVYDPATGAQMSIYGTILTYMFLLYFFVTDSHLSYIKIFDLSYEMIPIGFEKLEFDVFAVIVEYFGEILSLALKLAMPIVAAELILDFCMGILMKAVPQIQVMQVNVQLKLLFGLFMVFLIASPLASMINRYITILIDNLVSLLPAISV